MDDNDDTITVRFSISESELDEATSEIAQAFDQFDPLNAFFSVRNFLEKLSAGNNRYPREDK